MCQLSILLKLLPKHQIHISQQKQQHSPIYVLSRQPLPSTFCWSKVQTPCPTIIYDIPSMFLSSSPDLEAGNSRPSSRRGVSGGVEGHHWEYNPFLVQSTVHTVFTPMLSSYMGRVKLLHHGAHIHCFYRPHITCCWQNFFDWYIRCL